MSCSSQIQRTNPSRSIPIPSIQPILTQCKKPTYLTLSKYKEPAFLAPSIPLTYEFLLQDGSTFHFSGTSWDSIKSITDEISERHGGQTFRYIIEQERVNGDVTGDYLVEKFYKYDPVPPVITVDVLVEQCGA